MAMEYVPGNSILHRMDPRTKIFIFLCLVILSVVVLDPVLIAVMLVIVFITYRTAGIPKDKLMTVLRASGPAVILFLILNYIAVPPLAGEPIYFYLIPGTPWGPVTFHTTLVGISSGLRFLFFIVVTRLITLVTPISDLLVALVRMRLPVEAAVSLGIAFASVPLMINQFRTVIEAQKSRGAKFEMRNPLRKFRAYVPIIVPSIYLTVLRGLDISRTIESRAFTYNPSKRTFRRELVLRALDYGGILVAGLIVLGIVYLKILNSAWFGFHFSVDILGVTVLAWLAPYLIPIGNAFVQLVGSFFEMIRQGFLRFIHFVVP